MKKILFLMVLPVLAFSQFGLIYVDTARVTNSTTVVANYAAGDLIRTDSTAFYSLKTGSGSRPSSGWIRTVIVETDTLNVTNASFIVRFYNFNSVDTTGTGATSITDTLGYTILTSADNAAFKNNYHQFDKFLVGDVAATVQSYGGGSGSTSAKAVNFAANLPFTTSKGKIWFVLLANGTYTPSQASVYRVKVAFERTR